MKINQPTSIGTSGSPIPPSGGGTGTSTVFTQGSVIFAGASGIYSQDNANFFYDATNKRLGIGISNPQSKIEVYDESSGDPMTFYKFSSNPVLAGGFFARKARNTMAAPQTVLADDRLLSLLGGGYNGSAYNAYSAAVLFFASENYSSSSNNGSYITFETTLNGTTGRTERMRISNSGFIGIGTNNPGFILDVLAPSSNVARFAAANGSIFLNAASGANEIVSRNGANSAFQDFGIRAAASGQGIYLNTSGMVGLMTNAPTHTLTLGSTSNGFAYYNTADQTTNYERLLVSPVANVFTVASQNGGTGTLRSIAVIAPSTTYTGDLKLGTAGNGFYVKEGSNATMGTGTLSGGTLVVSTTKVTASSRIFLTDTGGGVLANIGALYISARSAGTSFTVSSSNALDTSTFNWIIFEPA